MNVMKRSLSALLCLVLVLGFAQSAMAAGLTQAQWDTHYAQYSENAAAVMLTPGSDNTQRNLSWYAAYDGGMTFSVRLAESEDMKNAKEFTASSIKTPEGDDRVMATITGLEAGKTYYYQCMTGKIIAGSGQFNTLAGKDFSMLYTSDIHISEGEESKNAYNLHQALEAALERSPNLSLIVSGGDQATNGLRSEYTSLLASPILSQIPLATVIGNHDRKGVNYKYWANNPNTQKRPFSSSYMGKDYWFVQGDVLFLMYDSNNVSMADHYAFTRKAVKANPDVKWRTAVFHHDLHGGRIPSRESENRLLRLLWGPILDQFQIDLALMGHSHFETISNVVYNNKTVQPLEGKNSVTDAEGTIYLVSGSINRPRYDPESGEEEPPLGDNIGQYSVLTTERLYNILDFTDNSVTIKTYSVEQADCLNTLTIEKTSQQGGHPQRCLKWYAPFTWVISGIVAVFNNLGNRVDVLYK